MKHIARIVWMLCMVGSLCLGCTEQSNLKAMLIDLEAHDRNLSDLIGRMGRNASADLELYEQFPELATSRYVQKLADSVGKPFVVSAAYVALLQQANRLDEASALLGVFGDEVCGLSVDQVCSDYDRRLLNLVGELWAVEVSHSVANMSFGEEWAAAIAIADRYANVTPDLVWRIESPSIYVRSRYAEESFRLGHQEAFFAGIVDLANTCTELEVRPECAETIERMMGGVCSKQWALEFLEQLPRPVGTFDSELWRVGDVAVRASMALDLSKSWITYGMAREEVISLLGPPDDTGPKTFRYKLGSDVRGMENLFAERQKQQAPPGGLGKPESRFVLRLGFELCPREFRVVDLDLFLSD